MTGEPDLNRDEMSLQAHERRFPDPHLQIARVVRSQCLPLLLFVSTVSSLSGQLAVNPNGSEERRLNEMLRSMDSPEATASGVYRSLVTRIKLAASPATPEPSANESPAPAGQIQHQPFTRQDRTMDLRQRFEGVRQETKTLDPAERKARQEALLQDYLVQKATANVARKETHAFLSLTASLSTGANPESLSEQRLALREIMARGTTEQKQAIIEQYLEAVRQKREVRLQAAQQAKPGAER